MFGSAAIREVREEVAKVAAAFDASVISATDAAAIVQDAAAIESMAATIKAMAAARVAESSSVWRAGGDSSPAHQLARVTGTTVARAKETLETAARLASLPSTQGAARRGELSPAQVAVIADAAVRAPEEEARLVATAKASSLGELRDECARVRAAADPDPEARRRAIHASRFARRRALPDGAAEIHYRATPEAVAQVWSVIDGYCEIEFERARAEGRRESFDAYAADAVLAVAQAAARRRGRDASSGADEVTARSTPPEAASPAKVIVRIDHAALLRGRVVGDEVCEIAGLGPIAVSAVEELLASGDAFVAAVLTKGVDVVRVAHLGRKPTAFQRTALQWVMPTCTVLGCNRSARLETDHRIDWAESRRTRLDELDLLCRHHHALKTRENWQLVAGSGKRAMVPRDDPRHPRHAAVMARAGPAA